MAQSSLNCFSRHFEFFQKRILTQNGGIGKIGIRRLLWAYVWCLSCSRCVSITFIG